MESVNLNNRFKISLMALVVCTIVICFLPYLFTQFSWFGLDFTTLGQIGDVIGGTMGPFVAIVVGFLTFLAFWIQYEANEQQKQNIEEQKKSADIDRIETRFFEMLKFHRENVNEMSYTYYRRKSNNEKSKANTSSSLEMPLPISNRQNKESKRDTIPLSSSSNSKNEDTKKHTSVSRKVFKIIFSDFEKLNDELKYFFIAKTKTDIYCENYLQELEQNKAVTNRKIDLILYAKMDILYCILYFGVSESGIQAIGGFLKDRYNEEFYKPVLKFASLKPVEESDYWKYWKSLMVTEEYIDWNKWSNKIYKAEHINWIDFKDIDKITKIQESNELMHFDIIGEFAKREQIDGAFYGNFDNYTKYYGGHQFRLGHYFRNLYQAVTYIDEKELLDYDKKYENIKLLRGQFSNYEQLIIFFNSISVLGRIWELEDKNKSNKNIETNKQLITKYNLIKNITVDKVIEGVSIRGFYPNIFYEAFNIHNIKEKREELKAEYRKNEQITNSTSKQVKSIRILFSKYHLSVTKD